MDDPPNPDVCAIVGFGTAQATLEEIAQLRKDPGPGRPKALEFQVLKHADEHTVLALAAMLNGLASMPRETAYGDWGIVAAPRWPGRLGTLAALERHRADGPRGVSPLTIPHVCLHSLSGTVSLVFEMRGPNFGVGGGLANVADGLLAGLTVQTERQLPGTWVIFSEWDVELGQNTSATPRARALALALGPVVPASAACLTPDLAVTRGAGRRSSDIAVKQLILRPTNKICREPARPRLPELIDYILNCDGTQAEGGACLPWTCTLDWGMELVVNA